MTLYRKQTGTPMRALILGVLAALFANVACAATVHVTPASLPAAVGAAQAGDVLILGPGQYAPVVIRGKYPGAPLTLLLGDAQVAGIYCAGASNLRVVGGRLTTSPWLAAAYLSGCDHVELRDLSVAGDGKNPGVVVRNSSVVTLAHARIDAAFAGVQLLDSSDLVLADNELTGIVADGITGASAVRAVIDRTYCHDFANDGSHHADCIQVWTVAGHVQASDIAITRTRCDGFMQCADDFGGDARGVARLSITDTEARLLLPNGVAIQKSAGGIALRNHTSTIPIGPGETKPAGYSRVSQNYTAPGVDHCGNTAEPGAGKPAWADAPCPAN